MTDNRPLSENEADDRLKAALSALGEAPGLTVAADTALAAARRALSLISLGLIAAGVKRELKARPQDSLATDCRTRSVASDLILGKAALVGEHGACLMDWRANCRHYRLRPG
jgi:hypothetical protein